MTTTISHSVRETHPACIDDAHWAQNSAEVEREFGGEWVVAQEGRVIAHGDDPLQVRQEAGRLLGRDPNDLIVCAIPNEASCVADA